MSASSLQDLLKIPWMGVRPDLILHAGPLDSNGERTWILEDPVRGNNYRLGYAEGELFFRLTTEPTLDEAVKRLFATTTLRPTPQEILNFVSMLQKEHLAILPPETVIQQESKKTSVDSSSIFQKILHGSIYFKIPLIKPDRFLTKTLPYVSWLWSPFFQMLYLCCGGIGLIRTIQEIERYTATVSYLFTPQGVYSFVACLILLKIGHEFAHAYTAKFLGLHVRSMGVFFIALMPLLYTDTTDVWKVPNRRQRRWVSIAGIMFELTIAGIALLLWSVFPDGILKSIMFFLSSTSLVSSIFINLNPFMRFDGYYYLMDAWGIDNLRPRAMALLRHGVRRLLLDWKGPIPEHHPRHRSLIFYGICALIYRIFIGFSIAVAVYYLYYPIVGIIVVLIAIWMFILQPLWYEISSVIKERKYIGSRTRLLISSCCLGCLILFIILPLPRYERLPCLLIHKNTSKMVAPASGFLMTELPMLHSSVAEGDILAKIVDESLTYEAENIKFDLAGVQSRINYLGSGGEQGAYRMWLMAEQERLQAALEKVNLAISQLEVRSPVNGKIVDINEELYKGASVYKGMYLFTIANPEEYEIKAYVHERLIKKIDSFEINQANVHFPGFNFQKLKAYFKEKSVFPVRYFPNDSLFDFAGGPILSVDEPSGRKDNLRIPRDTYYTYTFEVVPDHPQIPHGLPAWIWVKSQYQSFGKQAISKIWQKIMERGFF